jgi:NADH-quinone oxidoreductase subunit N
VSFAGIQAAEQGSLVLVFGLCSVRGFCFKVSAVPFHMWTPDVYEGRRRRSPPSCRWPKVAGIAMFVRATIVPFRASRSGSRSYLVAIASMALGACAIGQRNIKRLMAYSPSAIWASRWSAGRRHRRRRTGCAGLHGDLCGDDGRHLRRIPAMRRDGRLVEDIGDLAARTHAADGAVPAVLLFSLAGIPPLAGFFAKFYVFWRRSGGLFALAVIGVLVAWSAPTTISPS